MKQAQTLVEIVVTMALCAIIGIVLFNQFNDRGKEMLSNFILKMNNDDSYSMPPMTQ